MTWETTVLWVEQLVLDPALQCRAAMVEEVVEEYAEAYRSGATLPPIRVVRAEGSLLLVDGFHRVEAARRAKVAQLPAQLAEGVRRDAMLEAIRANATHGLRRTVEDKRRAILALLMDGDWCKLSSRELAKLAGVSHTAINQARQRYDCGAGKVLTDATIAAVDGGPPPAWQKLLSGLKPWQAQGVELIRTTRTARALALHWSESAAPHILAALRLRAEELATGDWPWPEDVTAVDFRRRVAHLDTVEDLERAAVAFDWTGDEVWIALRDAVKLAEGRWSSWEWKSLAERVAGRPALAAAVAELQRAEQAETEARPWYIADQIRALADGVEQAAAIGAASREVLGALCNNRQRLTLIGEEALREAIAPDGGVACPDPECGGWALTAGSCCRVCGNAPERLHRSIETSLTNAAQLLPTGRYGLVVVSAGGPADGVSIDSTAIALLAALQPSAPDPALDKWLAKAPPDVRAALERWFEGVELDLVVGPDGVRGGNVAGDDAAEVA